MTEIKNKKRTLGLQKNQTLVPSDPLQQYLQKVSRYPLLSEEEEKELVEKMHQFKDVEAAKKLVTSHLRLVVKIAMEYRSAYQNVLDLIQEGNVGLLKAVKNYDPEKGARVAYYASWWIRSYILKYILDNFRLIKIGTTQVQRKLFFNLMKEKEDLEKKGFASDSKVLAERLDVSEEDINDMSLRLANSELSIDVPVGENNGTLHVDLLKDSSKPVDETLSEHQVKDALLEKLGQFSKTLNTRELKIFQERLVADMPKTLQDIADEYGITRERVRQLEERIKEKLKGYFEGDAPKESEKLLN
ncbi:MAG: RNA polymerase factor sigma-32 [Deltaproteobacteria bacterium]|nr:RNA polymerase factor sigma-32 [Deltaproteobacteria bacterium]